MELVIITICAIGIIALALEVFSIWQRLGSHLERQDQLARALHDLSDTLESMKDEHEGVGSNILAELLDLKAATGVSKEPVETDEIYENARALVVETRRASTSLIQRVFQIGYSRAAKLIDQLEQNGVISEFREDRPREVLEPEES